MLYKKNLSEKLSPELFENPTAEYRGTPFWAWNCKVTPDLITRQLGYLKEMGFGGGHLHSRTGMDVDYLSDEFMSLIRHCADECKRLDMLAWLYDEDRWPSGAAGGLVTKTPKYRQRYLLLTKKDLTPGMKPKGDAIELGEPYLFRVYDIVQNPAGELVSYRIIDPADAAEGSKWFTYCQTSGKSGWYNNQTYVDTLSKPAIDKFIETTHERYKETVGDDFDGVVPAIFTDEPQFSHKGTFAFATSEQDVALPWTPDLDSLYEARYGEKLDEKLPELFWELENGEVSRTRYLYHDFVCQLFTEAFADNCGDWCEQNGIAMTGHMMAEDSLQSQTSYLGEAMRAYRKFQIPGIDMLCDGHNYATAKQCQSAVHQYGREGMLSELYGVTDWDFDFRGHKHQGDWQAALGVTVRVPHLAWMSMKGEAKRDYPASISYQSPWYKEYGYIENHFSRLNTALTRGKPGVDIAVIHPVESYWLHWGPSENTGTVRSGMESNFFSVLDWLLFAQLDFDYISESLLPEQFGGASNGELSVGEMKYKVVVVPALETIRKSTLDVLEKFKAAGGTVIFLGSLPSCIDAVKSALPEFVDDCAKVSLSRDELIAALEPFRRVGIRDGSGNIAGDYIYNYRNDCDCDWLFVCHGKAPNRVGRQGRYIAADNLRITVDGEFTPVIWDTLNGGTLPAQYSVANGKTTIYRSLHDYDSLLLQLLPYDESVKSVAPTAKPVKDTIRSFKPVTYRLDEPNALLLDRAEFRIDSESLTSDSAWEREEEILRIHAISAARLGIRNSDAQPWVEPPEELTHRVDLKFVFNSEIEVEGAYLALENAALCEVVLNGEPASKELSGYFVDESIEKVALPKLRKGENILLVRSPIGIRTKLEWCYLLGEFGVTIAGCECTIVALPEKLGFSTVTMQRLPFYTGNIEYDEEIELTEERELSVRVSEYRGALVRVSVDGEDKGVIAFAPYKLDLGRLPAGKHTVTYKLFGTRFNAFGPIHNTVRGDRWVGPNIWHTQNANWCYEYLIRDEGILTSPVIELH